MAWRVEDGSLRPLANFPQAVPYATHTIAAGGDILAIASGRGSSFEGAITNQLSIYRIDNVSGTLTFLDRKVFDDFEPPYPRTMLVDAAQSRVYMHFHIGTSSADIRSFDITKDGIRPPSVLEVGWRSFITRFQRSPIGDCMYTEESITGNFGAEPTFAHTWIVQKDGLLQSTTQQIAHYFSDGSGDDDTYLWGTALSPDGRYFATASTLGLTIFRFSLDGSVTQLGEPLGGESQSDVALGRQYAYAKNKNALSVYRIISDGRHELIQTISLPTDWPNIILSPNERYVVTWDATRLTVYPIENDGRLGEPMLVDLPEGVLSVAMR